MKTQLPVAIEAISIENSPTIYKADGLKPFISHIKEQVSGEVPDLATKKGRDRIASLAAQVSRSKTAIEKPGRDYLKHLKELPKAVEAELREFVRECDALRDEIRKPLTDWEREEKQRVDGHMSNIAWFAETSELGLSSAEISHNLTAVEQSPIGDHCEEYLSQYVSAKDAAIQRLKTRYAATLNAEQQAAELARLQKEVAEREQKEREERIARQAAAEAKQAAEDEARRQIEEMERREIQLKQDAESAEKRMLEAEQKAQKAAEEERARILQQQENERLAEEKRLENQEHKREVNRKIVSILVSAGLSEIDAKNVVLLAAKGQCGRLVISY